ncbi:MAG: hypothetical protein RLZZ426_914, partial [Actinomycetota bacterium]
MADISEITANYQEQRNLLISANRASSVQLRQDLVHLTDTWLREVANTANINNSRASLIAVGGYGRGDLCAASDLDLLLLHHADEPIDSTLKLADALWYPIWDLGIALDHSVRDISQARRIASTDLKVVLGLLDARTIAGDDELTQQLRSSVLADWRAAARNRLPELFESVTQRRQRAGDLSHLLEPDLKESYGGLRDFTV